MDLEAQDMDPLEEGEIAEESFMGGGSLRLNYVQDIDYTLKLYLHSFDQTIFKDIKNTLAKRPGYVQIINDSVLQVQCINNLNSLGRHMTQSDERTNYPQIIEAPPVILTRIIFTYPIPTKHMQTDLSSSYRTSSETDGNEIVSCLQRYTKASEYWSRRMVQFFMKHIFKYDFSTLFILTALYESSAYFANLAHINLIQCQAPCDGITVCDMSQLGHEAVFNVNIAIEAIEHRRICLDSKYLSPQDIQLLRALTAGAQALSPASDQQRTPIGCTFDSPGIRFMIYSNGPWELPPPVNLTADTVRASALHLASILNSRDAYVRGYVRAQIMLNGMIVTHHTRRPNEGPQHQQYFMSSLETQFMDLPHPIGHNFLWRIMNLDPEVDIVDLRYENEFNNMLTCPTEMSVRVGAAIATLFGLGISATLHTYNISGACLNEYIRPGEYIAVRQHLDTLFRGNTFSIFPTIYRTACAFVEQFTGSTLNYQCFQSIQWSGNISNMSNGQGFRFWQQVWGRNIPYIVRPLSINWHFKRWPSIWGYSSPSIKFNLQPLMKVDENSQEQILAAGNAESLYETTLSESFPFKYVPYGNMLLNTLSQHLRDPIPLVVSYRHAFKKLDGTCHIHSKWLEGEALQPTYMANFFSYEVGQMPTYDWKYEVILIPHFRRMHQRPHIWEQLITDNASVSEYAGLRK